MKKYLQITLMIIFTLAATFISVGTEPVSNDKCSREWEQELHMGKTAGSYSFLHCTRLLF